jgi:hypothetical protein
MGKIRLTLTCQDGHEWQTAAEGPPAVLSDTKKQAGFHLSPEDEYCPQCGENWVRLALAKEG